MIVRETNVKVRNFTSKGIHPNEMTEMIEIGWTPDTNKIAITQIRSVSNPLPMQSSVSRAISHAFMRTIFIYFIFSLEAITYIDTAGAALHDIIIICINGTN